MIQITIDNSTDARSLEIMAEMLKAMAAARDLRQKHLCTVGVKVDAKDAMRLVEETAAKITASAAPLKMGDVSHLAADNCPSHEGPDHEDGPTSEGYTPGFEARCGESPELDANNLPWDERIHSSNRAKNTDGTWRRRRGIDDELFNAIAAELRGEVPAADPKSGPITEIVAAVIPSLFAPPPPAALSAPPVVPSVTSAAEPAAVFAGTPAAPVSSRNFANLVGAIVAQGIAADKVTEACQAEGVANLAVLGAQPDKVAAVAARLGL